MQDSCFLWAGSLRRKKIILDGHVSQSEERAVPGKTFAIAKDRRAIQISVSNMGMSFSYHGEIQRVRQPLCPSVFQDSDEVHGFLLFISWFYSLLSGFVFKLALSSSW